MVTISKFALLVSMLLTISFALDLKDNESDGFLPHKVTVHVTNNMSNHELGIDCKDKNTDFGFQSLKYSGSYVFTFRPQFFSGSLYFCKFSWPNVVHFFDIYIQDRDEETCNSDCYWLINESGPCMVAFNKYTSINCYTWNKVNIRNRKLDHMLDV